MASPLPPAPFSLLRGSALGWVRGLVLGLFGASLGGWLAGRLAAWLAGWLACWLACLLACWLAGKKSLLIIFVNLFLNINIEIPQEFLI